MLHTFPPQSLNLFPARNYTRNLGNNTYGPGDPSYAVASHGDRCAGERAAVATTGGSRRKSHGGKATSRSLMLPPCCSTPMSRAATQARGLVPAASVQSRISSRRMSGYSCGNPSRAACPPLKARGIALSTGPFCCGVYGAVNSRRIPRPLQKSTNILFEYSVPLSVRNARRTPISAMKRFTTERMAAALFSRTPYGRCRREALSTNITTYRDPPREVG